jgi:hypothetical protein
MRCLVLLLVALLLRQPCDPKPKPIPTKPKPTQPDPRIQ